MSVATYTKAGTKATTPVKLNKEVFAVEIKNHELLKSAYVAYLANGRGANATTKTRGLVRGGGRKPWRQKGTGRARFGSSRNPIWRGGGVVFGPDGTENYTHKLHATAKRQALKQALTLAAQANKISIVEAFDHKEKAVKPVLDLIKKIGATGQILFVGTEKNEVTELSMRNLQNVSLKTASYLTVYDVMNADNLLISKDAIDALNARLIATKEAK